MMFISRSFAVALTGAVLCVSLPSMAAGSYEGSWEVKILPAGTVTASSGVFQCPESIVKLNVKDGAISGPLERIADGKIINGYDRNAVMLKGTVDSSGNIQAAWQDWRIKGQIAGNKISLSWNDECGLRYANGRPD